ncbi:MAG: Mur ligase domain-containing protein, partial [Aquificaceae bacterium]
MNLKELLSESKGITSNSKEVKPGYIFVAIKGTQADGHHFVEEALQRGALWVLVERDVDLSDPRILKVKDTRRALAELAGLFYGKPSEELRVIGITGTNGKTTSTHVVESILSRAGIKTGLMGTIYYRLGERIYEYEG